MITWDLYLTYIRDVKRVKCEGRNLNVYRSRFHTLSTYFDQKPFNRYTCDQFLVSFTGKSNSTVNNHLKIIKNVCLALRYYQMEDEEVLRRIEDIKYLPKKKVRIIDILTPHEVYQLANLKVPYYYSKIKKNYRYKAIIYTLSLGLRFSEMQQLQWSDYRDDYFIIGEDGKTPDAYRKIYCPNKIRIVLQKLDRYKHGYIFGSLQGPVDRNKLAKDLKMRAEILGLKKEVRTHTFRHSFIVYALEAGNAIQDVMYTVGHKDPRITAEYGHLGLRNTKRVVESSPYFKSTILEEAKERLKMKIEKVYDKDRLRAIDNLLTQ